MDHRQRADLENYLSLLMLGHTHALTVTLHNDRFQESILNRRLRFEATILHMLYRIDRKCFKRSHKRKGYRIGSVTVLEGGGNATRLHAHLALLCPPSIPDEQFQYAVSTAVRECKSLGPEYRLKPITDSNGWAIYLAKEGAEAFSPRCTQTAKY